MDWKKIKRIETVEEYNAVCVRVDKLINEATEKGLLESEYDNEYTREIGHLSRLGAIYEDEYMTFNYINTRKKMQPKRNKKELNVSLLLEYA